MAGGGTLPRLAPLDHVRALYKDAEALLPPDRPITRKQDLIRAVRAMSPGLLSRKAPHTASAGALPTASGMRDGYSASLAPSSSAAEISRMTTGAPALADALDSTARTVQELETTVNSSAKAFNELKQKVVAREKKLQDLKTELAALRNENNTLAAVEARTHLLGVGMQQGQGKAFMPAGNTLVSEVAALIGLESEDEGNGSDEDEEGEEWSLRMNSSTSDRHNRAQTVALLTKSQRMAQTSAADRGAPLITTAVSSFSATAFPSLAVNPPSTSPAATGTTDAGAIGPSRAGVPSSTTHLLAATTGRATTSKTTSGAGAANTAGITLTLTPVELAEVERIRSLRRQIKAVRRSMAKRDFTRRQYEYMAARLRGNAAAFERHMKGLDDAIRAARKELGDVAGYLRMLETSKDGAVTELHKLQEQLGHERAARAKDLEERRAELTRATQMEAWRRQRAAVRAEMRAELAGDLSREQEEQLLATLRSKEAALSQLQTERRAREERAAALQDAFMRIKAATGVNNLDEMVDRFLSAPHLRTALEKERADAEARLATTRDALEAAQKEYDDLKASGGATGAATASVAILRGDDSFKDELDRLEKTLAGARSMLKLHRSGVERLENILLTVRQGAVGLAAMLEPFKEILPGNVQVAMALGLSPALPGGDGQTSPQSPSRSPLQSSRGDDSPRSSIGSPRLLDVRRQGNDTLKYLSRVDAGLTGMIDILARAVREHVRATGADLSSDAELFKSLESLLKLGDDELQTRRDADEATNESKGDADAPQSNAPAHTTAASALEARLADVLLSRARSLRGLSVASMRMLAAGPLGPEPVLQPRPSSRGFLQAAEAASGPLPSLASLPAPPTMPAAENDVSLSSVTLPSQWRAGTAAETSPGRVPDPVVVHENNIRVSPRPAVDPVTGALIDGRHGAHSHDRSAVSGDESVHPAAPSVDAVYASSMDRASDVGSAADDDVESVLRAGLRTGFNRAGLPVSPAAIGSPGAVRRGATAAAGSHRDAGEALSARGSVLSASSARVPAAARDRLAGATSPAGFRASQHAVHAGAAGHAAAPPDEHALATLSALGVTHIPGVTLGASSHKHDEDDEILDRSALKRRAAELHHVRADETRKRTGDPATSTSAAPASSSGSAAARLSDAHATSSPGMRTSTAGMTVRGRPGAEHGAGGAPAGAGGAVSGLAYLTQRPKLH